MRSYLNGAALALGLAVLTACGTGADAGRPCTAIAARQGIGLDIPAPYGEKVAEARMTICWDGVCREPDLHLMPSTTAVPQGCVPDGAVCAASASPDGGKHGFADLRELPATPVQVTVVLRDASGARLLGQKIEVKPHVTYPNGRECGQGDPQATLVVTNGKVTVRG
jgi:hypothetical protein